MLEVRRAGRTFLLNSPFAPGRGLGQLPRTVQQQIIEKKLQVLRHRRLRSGQRDRHGRAHQHRHADLLLRHQRRAAARGGHRAHQARHRENLRQARGSGGEEEFRRGGRGARPSSRSEDSGRREQQFELRPPVPAQAPEFVRTSWARSSRATATCCRSAPCRGRHVPHGHRAVGEAQHRARDPGLGREALHPVRQVRAGVPARGDPGQDLRPGAAGRSRRPRSNRRRRAGRNARSCKLHPAGGAGGLHRLRAVRARSARSRTRATPSARPSTWRTQLPLRETEAANWDFFLDAAGIRPQQAFAWTR